MGRKANPLWTEEKIAILQEQASWGVKPSVIARKLGEGFTTNMVFAKLYSLQKADVVGPIKPPYKRLRCSLRWGPEPTKIVRDGWAEGLSAGEIAKKLGPSYTRNAVIGRVHRLGLHKRHNPTKRGSDRKSYPRHINPKSPRLNGVRTMATLVPRETPSTPPGDASVKPEPLNVKLVDLNTTHCRSISGYGIDGGALFCGHPAMDGFSWCPHHAKIYFQPPRPRKR